MTTRPADVSVLHCTAEVRVPSFHRVPQLGLPDENFPRARSSRAAEVMQKIQSELFAAKERIHQPRTLFVVESGLVPLGPSWTRGMPGRQ